MRFKGLIKNLIFAFAVIVISGVIARYWRTENIQKIAYVDTPRMMQGFKNAVAVEKELDSLKQVYSSNLTALTDSLKRSVEAMSGKYNSANPEKKKDLENKLAQANENVARYRKAGMDKLLEIRQERMNALEGMINPFTKEYGKKNGYVIRTGSDQV